MKRLATVTAVVALLTSFAQAPFAHVHRRDPDHGHARAMPHSHLGLPPDQHVAAHGSDDDDDVQPVDLVIVTKTSAQPFVAMAGEPLVIPAPRPHFELVRTPSPRAHDPPGLHALSPRAPPV